MWNSEIFILHTFKIHVLFTFESGDLQTGPRQVSTAPFAKSEEVLVKHDSNLVYKFSFKESANDLTKF